MSHADGCQCPECGASLPDLPLDFAYKLPDCIFALPASERSPRCNADFSELGERKFVRGLLPVSVEGGEEFRYGVWLEVDGATYSRVLLAWNDPPSYRLLTFTARLANALEPFGAEALGTPVEVATRTETARPFVVGTSSGWLARLLSDGWTREEFVRHAASLANSSSST